MRLFPGNQEALSLNDKRMIVGGGKTVRQPTKYARARVKNGRGFTMHDLFRMDDLAAESLTYKLWWPRQTPNMGISLSYDATSGN